MAGAVRSALPVDDYLPAIADALAQHRAVVVTAAPGAGKTTRVPPALVNDGPVLLLQPRRVAARSIARRIADEQGWTIGREVGWHVRFDRRDSRETRLLVATEGILTARLQSDPLLSGFRTIVIDEFHERSIHADLGLALAWQAWHARDDLRLVVMSATIDSARVSSYLDGCPVIDVPGRTFPIEIAYRPSVTIEDAVAEAVATADGAILGFLPGAGEIRRAIDALRSRLGDRIPVLPLYGGLDADEQDAALTPSDRPRVVLATNIAETTLTVPDVRVVVDAGWQKIARYDAERGLDSLETERISADAADQRAGRAGRVAAGRAVRLWDPRERLRPHREPDIARVDLASPLLDVIAWGGDPRTLDWFEAPPAGALDRAIDLLVALGIVDTSLHLTPLGQDVRRLPLHPRLGRLLIGTGAAPAAARACALLSERHFLPPAAGSTSCDLLAAVDRDQTLPPHVQRVARDIREIARQALGARARASIDDETFRRAVLGAYPDRVARRRAPGSDRFLLASGTGARLSRQSGVVHHEFIVAVDVAAGASVPGAPIVEATIRLATGIERDWIQPTSSMVEHRLDEDTGVVRAARFERYGAIVLREIAIDPDEAARARLIADGAKRCGPTEEQSQLLRRLAAAGAPMSFDALVDQASAFARRLADVDITSVLPNDARRALERFAPAELPLPSGRHARLRYQDDGRVVAAVKLQELFGLA
ncbi:MAG TPA: DEAD/DEAH box helicase, partial [Vicinamibacterales bacterium]|nr:DEAD/DEAH box helicase [Vicinamibacterales bacterium]